MKEKKIPSKSLVWAVGKRDRSVIKVGEYEGRPVYREIISKKYICQNCKHQFSYEIPMPGKLVVCPKCEGTQKP